MSVDFIHYDKNEELTGDLIYNQMTKDKTVLKKVTQGATDYITTSSNTWHMDITIQYEQVKDKFVNIVYKDGANGTVFTNQVQQGLVGNITPQFDLDSNEVNGYQNPTRKGYTFNGWSPVVAEKVVDPQNNTNEIIYTAQWDKDDSQTQVTNYFVQYAQDGVLVEKDSYEVSSRAWVNDYPAMIEIQDEIIAPSDKYLGYKLDEKNEIPVKGDKVKSGTIITVNYVRDDSQTKDYSYTIEYIVDGHLRDADKVTLTQWVNEEAPEMLNVSDINYRTYEGYVVDTNVTIIPETIKVNGVIKVYYELEQDIIGPENPDQDENVSIPPVDSTNPLVPIAPVNPESPEISMTPDIETTQPNAPMTQATTTPVETNTTTPVRTVVDDIDVGDVEVVEDEDTPLANLSEENIDNNQTPLAGGNGVWALVNLISAVVTVLFGLVLLVSKKNKEDNDKNAKRGTMTRVLAVVVAIASVVTFFLTENLSLKMVMTDKWTVMMLVIAFVQFVIFALGRKWKKENNNL